MHTGKTVCTRKNKGTTGRQGRLDPIDMDKVGLQAGECAIAYTCLLHQTVDLCLRKISVAPLFTFQNNDASSNSSAHVATGYNEGDESEVKREEDWFDNQQDAVPMVQASSKMLEVMANEVGLLIISILGLKAIYQRPVWQGPSDDPGSSSTPLGPGVEDINVAITQEGDGNTVTESDSELDSPIPPALAQPTWPTDTDLVYVAGTTKVILSNQGPLLRGIIQTAFENIRTSLLFEHAFPDSTVIGAMVMKAVFDAARNHIAPGGRYNSSASFVHQRLLSHDDYRAKICRLVRIITSCMTLLIIFPAMGTHRKFSIRSEGALRSNCSSRLLTHSIASNHHGNCPSATF